MATAHRVRRRIQVKRTEYQHRIMLIMTEGEADFLTAVMANIGGHPTQSPRKYAERIGAALTNATGQDYAATDAQLLIRGYIKFKKYASNTFLRERGKERGNAKEQRNRSSRVSAGGPST
jgi:hypothetical protein